MQIFESNEEEFTSASLSDKNSDFERTALKIGSVVNTINGIVKGRGLPYTTTMPEIKAFFNGFDIHSEGVYRGFYNNRPDSQFYAVFSTKEEASRAVETLHKKNIGKRYIELFECDPEAFKLFLFKNRKSLINKIEIEFEEGFEPQQRRGGSFGGQQRSGRGSTGGRNVYQNRYTRRRRSPKDDSSSDGYDKDHFRAERRARSKKQSGTTTEDRSPKRAKQSGYSPSKNPRTLLCKGFPYEAGIDDIKDFFAPHDREIEYVHFINLYDGRFSGNCFIVFDDRKSSLKAMAKRNYGYMGKRYI